MIEEKDFTENTIEENNSYENVKDFINFIMNKPRKLEIRK